jgi:hypothetical protein
VLGDVDGLTVPHPRQHLAGVMPQVPQAHRVRIRTSHAAARASCSAWACIAQLASGTPPMLITSVDLAFLG